MSAPLPLLAGALLGVTVGSLLVPLTRKELAAAVTRASISSVDSSPNDVENEDLRLEGWHWAALALLSGLLPAYVLYGVGWSLTALTPLLLVVGLIQLSYCDITRRLLPKTMVYGLTGVVVASGVAVAADLHMWERLEIASIGSLLFFAVFLVINLMNPHWIAFGDVRLSLVVGFGLAWVSPVALLEGFAVANLLAAAIGVALIVARRAERRSHVPFGLFLALGAAIVIATWT